MNVHFICQLSQMYAQIVKDTLLSKMASEHLESPSSYRPEEIQLLAGKPFILSFNIYQANEWCVLLVVGT